MITPRHEPEVRMAIVRKAIRSVRAPDPTDHLLDALRYAMGGMRMGKSEARRRAFQRREQWPTYITVDPAKLPGWSHLRIRRR